MLYVRSRYHADIYTHHYIPSTSIYLLNQNNKKIWAEKNWEKKLSNELKRRREGIVLTTEIPFPKKKSKYSKKPVAEILPQVGKVFDYCYHEFANGNIVVTRKGESEQAEAVASLQQESSQKIEQDDKVEVNSLKN